MNSKIAVIISLIVIFALAIILLGCGPTVVSVRPPEPRVEYHGEPPHPETVWIQGYWQHRGDEWVWIPGHWEKRPRPHAHWIPGRWEPRNGGWVWVKGHWENR